MLSWGRYVHKRSRKWIIFRKLWHPGKLTDLKFALHIHMFLRKTNLKQFKLFHQQDFFWFSVTFCFWPRANTRAVHKVNLVKELFIISSQNLPSALHNYVYRFSLISYVIISSEHNFKNDTCILHFGCQILADKLSLSQPGGTDYV